MGYRTYTQDAELIFKDAGAVTATGAATVGGSAATAIRDLGAVRNEMAMILDISSIKTSAGDERYEIIVQSSSSNIFSGDIENLGSIVFGAAAARPGGARKTNPGRREILFTTDLGGGLANKFVRVFAVVTGTAPSIAFTAWAAPLYG